MSDRAAELAASKNYPVTDYDTTRLYCVKIGEWSQLIPGPDVADFLKRESENIAERSRVGGTTISVVSAGLVANRYLNSKYWRSDY